MTEINLLPWREQKREQEKKQFIRMLLVAVCSAVLSVFFINYYALSLVKNQITRNQMLQNEIAIMDEQLKEIRNLQKEKELLISRMLIVRNLQSTRTLMVHLFDELIQVMPAGAYLRRVEGKDSLIALSGYAESNTTVSVLMKNIEMDSWLHNPILSEIKKVDENTPAADNQFQLNCTLAPQLQRGRA